MKKRNIYDEGNYFNNYLNNIHDTNIKTYIEERVIDQIKWYEKKSCKNQFWYRIFMVASIVMSGCIPVLTLMLDLVQGIEVKIIISILSSATTGISAVVALNNYYELWVQYRTNCEILKSVLYRFFTKSSEFKNLDDMEMYDMLVTSCENYIIKEFETWGSIKMTQTNLANN